MASNTTPKLQEWLVIIPDHADALQKRLGARGKHLEGLKGDREGMWLFGGAMLEEPHPYESKEPPKMKGSVMLVGAKTKEEVLERLEKDFYVKEGVWDLGKLQIMPFRSAIRTAL